MTFLLGIMIVWVYALIRTKLGPGPKTALMAGFVGWFCVYFYAGVLNGTLFGVPPFLMGVGLTWGLAEYLLGAIAGAWLYKEK
jgi:chromate transport protein ChrA